MRHSRMGIFVLFVCLLAMPLVAAENNQKIYSLDDDTYSAIQLLYISQGLSLPSTTGPYSQAELQLMLRRIDQQQLNQGLVPVYGYVVHKLGSEPKLQSDGIDMSWSVDINLEAYIHSNPSKFAGRDAWVRGPVEQKPFITVGFETWPVESFYGYSALNWRNNRELLNSFGSSAYRTNIIFLPPNDFGDFDMNFPDRAFVAAGSERWSVQLGRDRLNWGAGASGNLMVSDTFNYHNLARFTAFSDKYKYTFVTSFFPYPLEYMDEDNFHPNGVKGDALGDGIHLFMSHRLEWRLFNDKVGFTLTESLIYLHDNGVFDLRVLNPAMLFHNYYIRSNSNSMLGIEVDYTPIKGLNFYAQAAVDDFSMPGEGNKPTESEANNPNAMGFLAGVKRVFPVKKLVGYTSLEVAKTDPYLYLRDGKAGEYDLSYVGTIRTYQNWTGGYTYHPQVIGYTYGNDVIVVNLNGGLRSFGKWNVEANLRYMAHGTFDIFTKWSKVGGALSSEPGKPFVKTPTTNGNDSAGNYADPDYGLRNAVSHTVVAGVHGSYSIQKNLSVFGQVDFVSIANYKNISGEKARDVQITIGSCYSL